MTEHLNIDGTNTRDYTELLSAKIGGDNHGCLLCVLGTVEIDGHNTKFIKAKKIVIRGNNAGDLEAEEVYIDGHSKGTINAKKISIRGDNAGDLEATDTVEIDGHSKGTIKAKQISIRGDNAGDLGATDTVEIDGHSKGTIKAKQISIRGDNAGDLEATDTVEIDGHSKGTIKAKQISIRGDNAGDLEAADTVEIDGHNTKGTIKAKQISIRGNNHGDLEASESVEIRGNNAALVKAVKQVYLYANVRGGDVFANTIIYAGFEITAGLIRSMSVDEVITYEYEVGVVNNQRLVEQLTLTCLSEEKWQIKAQGVVNELTIAKSDHLSKETPLRLRYRSGELRSINYTTIVVGTSRRRRWWPFR